MPRLTPANREARRADIVAAARRCFSRDGFHQTSMPDIAAEAGVSTGAPYRYFASKEEIILEIARQAFRSVFDPVIDAAAGADGTTVAGIADLVDLAVQPMHQETAGATPTSATELFRCAVQTWGELLRHPQLRAEALSGFDEVRNALGTALRRGQETGRVSAAIDPEGAARVAIALIHGILLQWVAFDLEDLRGLAAEVRTLLATQSPPASTS